MLAFLPQLTELDPELSKEGALDPLGLGAIADHLGTRLAPGIRERQRHPRFLTAMAVGSIVCRDLSRAEHISKDGSTEPWLAYEWHVVNGMVLSASENDDIRGLPGRDKVTTCLRNGMALSAKQYLKTPGVFGFHGVYRVLAEQLKILSDSELGEAGHELLLAWERDQNLSGFFTSEGNGRKIRDEISYAVTDALNEGSIVKHRGWKYWQFFLDHLAPYTAGKQEADVLYRLLTAPEIENRPELVKFTETAKGQELCRNDSSEYEFHEALKTVSSPDLKRLLETIQSFEHFARRLLDAFETCLSTFTQRGGPVEISDLAKNEGIELARREVPQLYPRVSEQLHLFKKGIEFEQRFAAFRSEMAANDWVELLLQHHVKIQKQKPPDGKNPWVERHTDGRYLVRAAYRREPSSYGTRAYVHTYRTGSVWSFLKDLRRVSNE